MPFVLDVSEMGTYNWPLVNQFATVIDDLKKKGKIQRLGSIILFFRENENKKENIFEKYFKVTKN